MTDVTMANPSTALYSQTPTDDRGNFHYQGDLHRAGEPLPDLCRRIERHLASTFPDSRFALRSETFAGGRKITLELLDHPADLTAEVDRSTFTVAVRDQIERFGFTGRTSTRTICPAPSTTRCGSARPIGRRSPRVAAPPTRSSRS